MTGHVRFSDDKSGICFDKFARFTSNSKEKPILVKLDMKKNFIKRKPIRKIQTLRIPKQVSHSQEKVQEVGMFESYKHTLS